MDTTITYGRELSRGVYAQAVWVRFVAAEHQSDMWIGIERLLASRGLTQRFNNRAVGGIAGGNGGDQVFVAADTFQVVEITCRGWEESPRAGRL